MSNLEFSTMHLNFPVRWYAAVVLLVMGLLGACGGGGGGSDDIYAPKLTRLGTVPLLFHANAEQIPKLFPVGTPRSAIRDHFGPPAADSGSTHERDVYSASIGYWKFNPDYSSQAVLRVVAAYVEYDATGKVKAVTPNIFDSYTTTRNKVVVENRKPTPEEVARYLGAVNPVLVDSEIAKGYPGIAQVKSTPAASRATTPAAVARASAWHTGLQVMEFQTSNGRTEVRVSGFDEGSPAKARGVRVNDTIASVNGTKTATATDFANAIGKAPGDKPLTLHLLRGGKPITVSLPVTK